MLGYRALYVEDTRERKGVRDAETVRVHGQQESQHHLEYWKGFSWQTDPVPAYPAPHNKNFQGKAVTAAYPKILMVTWYLLVRKYWFS